MGRITITPIEYDDLKKLNISRLKEWGYLTKENYQSFEIYWTRDNIKTASIRCIVNIHELYLELSYNYNNKPINYRIKLHAKQSNLGKGTYYYFICNKSNKHARKLYLYNGLFVHRDCIKAYYFSQLVVVKHRPLIQMYRRQFEKEKLFEESLNKYYKRYYKSKPTKRYIKYLQYNLEPAIK